MTAHNRGEKDQEETEKEPDGNGKAASEQSASTSKLPKTHNPKDLR